MRPNLCAVLTRSVVAAYRRSYRLPVEAEFAEVHADTVNGALRSINQQTSNGEDHLTKQVGTLKVMIEQE